LIDSKPNVRISFTTSGFQDVGTFVYNLLSGYQMLAHVTVWHHNKSTLLLARPANVQFNSQLPPVASSGCSCCRPQFVLAQWWATWQAGHLWSVRPKLIIPGRFVNINLVYAFAVQAKLFSGLFCFQCTFECLNFNFIRSETILKNTVFQSKECYIEHLHLTQMVA